MNFKQLEAFLWVAELQSFTKAAKQLYMSQPAVSFQIKALEESLQVALFQRGDKKVILTDAGRFLYPEAKQILKHYQKIKTGLDELKGLKTGHLVIGAGTIPGEYLLPLFIGGFKEKYPGIKVTLRIAGSGRVGQWVREREVDLGITGAPIEGEGIECKHWIMDKLVLILPPSHPMAVRKTISVKELANIPFVVRERGSGTRQIIEQKFKEHGFTLEKLPVVMELGSTRAVITAVEAGLGASIVSQCAVRESLELGRVKEVQLAGVGLSRYLYQVRHSQGIEGFAAGAFIEYINDKDIIKKYYL